MFKYVKHERKALSLAKCCFAKLIIENQVKSQIYIHQGNSLSIHFIGRVSLATGATDY
jgi:hypothetical protein